MAARRLLEVQYEPGEELVFRFNTQHLGILPETTRGHLRNANKEFLLALRSVIDRSIERMERGTGQGRRRQRVQVEEERPARGRGRRVRVEETPK